jgi:two-component system, OmpR family, phosphate regulon sensor histidine kinase PhoR
VRFRAPANVLLRRAQLVLILAALVPTVFLTSLGIVLLAAGGVGAVRVVVGILVVAFCASALTGYILGSIFVGRGASLARIQNDYLSAVSHELRTPITSLRMFIETLRSGRVTDPAEREKCLTIMDKEMVRLDGLVAKLHELSRIESGKQVFERTPVTAEAIVTEALSAFEAVSLGRPIAIEKRLEPGLTTVGDRGALAHAVLNLLVNAWKYTGDDKRIVISTAPHNKREVEIAVTDNGPGIPEEERKRIFEPFERGRAAVASRSPGSGLGLAIVRALVRAQGGKVEVQDGPERGSRFRILLPRHPE